MKINNRDIAEFFDKTADLLEIKGDNPFRIRAYRQAAMTVHSLPRNAADLIKEGERLDRFPGIGKDLAGKIADIIKTGKFNLLEDLKKEIPEELAKMMKVSGLGAKRVAAIYKKLNISTLEELQLAAENGKVRDIAGFGVKTEKNIIEEVKRLRSEGGRRKIIFQAEEITTPLLKYLEKKGCVKQLTAAGSYRRRSDTVGDMDILAVCTKDCDIMDYFTKYDEVEKIISKGKTKSSVLLRSDFQVDLRVVPQVSYGAALLYFTGSKDHNIALRRIAQRKKYKINEYGVFKGTNRIAGETEEEIYKMFGLPWFPPELRENRGEIEIGRDEDLPDLIELEDIRGDLHVHTKYSDGNNTIREMAEAAKKKGYAYVAITDHSEHLTIAGGLKPKEVEKQLREIDRVRKDFKDLAILKGTEVDILEDGRLDMPDSLLSELDVRVCAVHMKFNLSKDQQTRRILKAMENPYFNILAHPTGRRLLDRPPYELDMEKIMKAAKENGCFLELNSYKDRLDLNDFYCKRAKELGVKIVIATDSHQTRHLDFMRLGIGQARRGWLEASDVINTLPLSKFRKLMKRR